VFSLQNILLVFTCVNWYARNLLKYLLSLENYLSSETSKEIMSVRYRTRTSET